MWRFLISGILGLVAVGAILSASAAHGQSGTAWFARLTVGNPEFEHQNALAFVGSATTRTYDLSLDSTTWLTLHGIYSAPHFRMARGGATYSAVVSAPIVTSNGVPQSLGWAVGFRAATPTIGADITTRVAGILIEAQQGGTSNWGLYQTGSDPNYFNGPTWLRQFYLPDSQGRWLPAEIGAADSCGIGRRCLSVTN